MTITSAHISVQASATSVKANTGANASVHPLAFSWHKLFIDGAGAGQFSLVYDTSIDLEALEVNEIDLSSVDLPLASAQAFAECKTVLIHNSGESDVTIGGNLGLAGILRAGGLFVLSNVDATGLAIVNGSADTITITNGSGAGSVRVIICGN